MIDAVMTVAYIMVIGVAVGAVAALLQKDLLRAVFLSGAESIALAFIFQALLAPDLGLTQAIVGTVLLPGIIILGIFKTRRKDEDD
ncbi:MAG: hydrogenase subunit MbhD domain-containing protein [Candidatus Methanomethylicaceae archaeon]|jgi:energy-converting hydrogenase B subunit D